MKRNLDVEWWPVAKLKPNPKNPRRHPREQIKKLKASLVERGFRKALVAQAKTGVIIAGHGMFQAAEELGYTEVPVSPWDCTDHQRDSLLLSDNELAKKSNDDDLMRASLLSQLIDEAGGIEELLAEGIGFDHHEVDTILAEFDFGDLDKLLDDPDDLLNNDAPVKGALVDKFGIPPFSVLNSAKGYWQDRKRAWRDLGLSSKEGRDEVLTFSALMNKWGDKSRAELLTQDTSEFDPVLCEIAYRWFSTPGGSVLDPFAGGSVRGVVAAALGHSYTGIDLSGKQVEANRARWEMIRPQIESVAARMKERPVVDDNMPEFTPIERRGEFWVKRDDLFAVAGASGGKVRTCWHLSQGVKGLITAGSRKSPQVAIVARIASRLGVPCRVHTPKGDFTPELVAARDAGAEVIQHYPGHNTVICARAREDAAAHGWTEIPFGMECDEAVRQTASQVPDEWPDEVKRIVIPVGSGMSLAGLLTGMAEKNNKLPVVGVVVGADPKKRLKKYAPAGWERMVELVASKHDYHDTVHTTIDRLALDPVYEAKCVEFMRPGDLLWVVGCREETAALNLNATRWKISAAWASKQLDCTLSGITRDGGCGAECCKNQKFWPPSTGKDGCVHLTDTGCSMGLKDRPVTCLLYPLRLTDSGTLVQHYRASRGGCKPCVKRGPILIDAMAAQLEALFGKSESDRVRGEIGAGRDAFVDVPLSVIEAMKSEAVWEAQNAPPSPRTEQVGPSGPVCVAPEWIHGNSENEIGRLGDFDMVFSCPPYYDLEKYTDDPGDLSNMPWDEFLTAYRGIIAAAVSKLKEHRFAVWVIGDVRDKAGAYRGLVAESIRAFADAGAVLYNEAILVTPLGTAPARAARYFTTARKLVRTHQHVLVFHKGPIDVGVMEAEFGEVSVKTLEEGE